MESWTESKNKNWKIKKVNSGSNKTDSYALIETAVDFEKLETVLVITNQ